MPKVIPFNGLLFNPDKVSESDVIAPPYDIISPGYKDALYNKSPFNIVRIDFGKDQPDDNAGSNRYTRASALLNKWIDEKILVKDSSPAFYAYEIEYIIMGKQKVLRGVFSLVEIVELGNGVWPHEETHSKPKADRLEIMRHCMANLSPIYSIYNSREKATSKMLASACCKPCISASDSDGTLHRLFRIDDPAKTAMISSELSGLPIFIADGHHRYEVALEFKKEMDSKTGRKDADPMPWDYMLMFLAEMSDPGITILPTHRMIKGISPKKEFFARLEHDFSIKELPASAEINSEIASAGRNSFGLYLGKEQKWFLLKYRGGTIRDIHPALQPLDAVILRELVLNRESGISEVAYEMSAEKAAERSGNGEFDAVFVLGPTGTGDIERVASANLRMPPKSTYFYPKLMTGMVINKF
jgi:uncharacterized protein (DUF1015 family)